MSCKQLQKGIASAGLKALTMNAVFLGGKQSVNLIATLNTLSQVRHWQVNEHDIHTLHKNLSVSSHLAWKQGATTAESATASQ